MASIIGVGVTAWVSWATGAAAEDFASTCGTGAAAASSAERASLSLPEARQEGQMLDLLSRYLYRFALRGTSASSSAVYSSMVKPHFAQQSLILSTCVFSSSQRATQARGVMTCGLPSEPSASSSGVTTPRPVSGLGL